VASRSERKKESRGVLEGKAFNLTPGYQKGGRGGVVDVEGGTRDGKRKEPLRRVGEGKCLGPVAILVTGTSTCDPFNPGKNEGGVKNRVGGGGLANSHEELDKRGEDWPGAQLPNLSLESKEKTFSVRTF